MATLEVEAPRANTLSMTDKNYETTVPRDAPPGIERLVAEVLHGLRKTRKELPSKYFYDERGAQLFERICALEEYYIPRTEAAIMEAHVQEMAELIGPDALVIEYGSGNCQKVRSLLERLFRPAAYIPIDICGEQLLDVTRELALAHPDLQILPVCADYTSSFELPVPERRSDRRVVYFPGSTIGNFERSSAEDFLRHVASLCGPGGALLIGVDLKKEPVVLHRAYNDEEGVTAAFNLNLLERINRELDGDFQLEWFRHHAFYDPSESRVEMHLVSQGPQEVHLYGETFSFVEGESIWTESSYKYSLRRFAQLAAAAGFKVERVWLDERQWFSVQYLVAR